MTNRMFGVDALPLFSNTAPRGWVETFDPAPVDPEPQPLPGMTEAMQEDAPDAGTVEAALVGARAVGLPVTVMGHFLLSDEPADDVQRRALAAVARAVEVECERCAVEIVR